MTGADPRGRRPPASPSPRPPKSATARAPTGREPEPAPRQAAPAAAPSPPAEACDPHGGCITCSDEGIPMRVVAEEAGGLALCEDERGGRREVMTGVVGRVRPGDWLLVHAGAALLRLDRPDAEAATPSPATPSPGRSSAGGHRGSTRTPATPTPGGTA